MKFSKNTFTDLAIRMIGFGVIIGVIFPFMVMLMGTPKSIAMSGWFFLGCILAGMIVGLMNILISRATVGNKLSHLTSKMNEVKDAVFQISDSGEMGECTPEKCSIRIESDDDFGKSARAFNDLIHAFSGSLKTLDEIKSYSELFSSQLDLQNLAQNTLQLVIRSSEANAGAIYIGREGEIKLLVSFGLKDAGEMETNQNISLAFNKGERLDIVHPDDIIVESTLTAFHPREVLIEPVSFKDIPIAVIVLAKADLFQTQAKKHLAIFSLSLATALNNALEHEQLQLIAALDPLTGIYNRRFGMVRMHEEYARAVRKDLPLGVMMLDIDHFKQVNDTHGHMAGDRVLKNLALYVRQCMREGDILIRYGGEEFLLVLPGASKDDSYKIAERIRHVVKDSTTAYGSNQISVTISIGCVSYPELSVESEQELIVKADESMYRAKESGRDRVVLL